MQYILIKKISEILMSRHLFIYWNSNNVKFKGLEKKHHRHKHNWTPYRTTKSSFSVHLNVFNTYLKHSRIFNQPRIRIKKNSQNSSLDNIFPRGWTRVRFFSRVTDQDPISSRVSDQDSIFRSLPFCWDPESHFVNTIRTPAMFPVRLRIWILVFG